MDQYDCGKRYVCELGVLAVAEEEEGEGVNLRDSELALLAPSWRYSIQFNSKKLYLE